MDPWIADPDSWQDMVDDWMGEPAGVLCEVDDNLRALDAHADPASFGGGPYPQMRDVDGNYAADGSRFNAIVGDASEAAEARQPRYQNHAMSMSMWLTVTQGIRPYALRPWTRTWMADLSREWASWRPSPTSGCDSTPCSSIILTPEQILATWVGHTGWPHRMATRAGHTGWPHRMATRD